MARGEKRFPLIRAKARHFIAGNGPFRPVI